ncbi:TIGR04283 family arsenosugar biosynthesis glycosyltransferase [Maribacter hydrothermalis]|uniref:Glycosyl transferase family 2 n=1 Tax=Maribacter hydrothermalis TaxID=1836467 RepID=A0A1B7YXW2_9FLAO|nr:TIGR04283 family arsenosugar biosynthesis glycosyltransferase [Maribacter hydrothermalis]APQ16903.1 glycosyl transferase family 2 [Maribacter hydrothermalis]OBR35331.1 glycosyl transferase family 2 [Maribacter hydrothermalis]
MSTHKPSISIIIPVLNEEKYIKNVLFAISTNTSTNHIKEILVVDGGSTDNTIANALKFGASVIKGRKGRAAQMNFGATKATGDILYFLHVDSLPPKDFDAAIIKAVEEGHNVGCFQMRFNSNSPFLKFFSWCTRINHQICRGGDQSLFITSTLFHKNNGFNEKFIIYEDNEFIQRMYKLMPFKIIPSAVTTSARRYEERGMIRLQWHFAMIHLKYFLGANPQELHQYYLKHIAV